MRVLVAGVGNLLRGDDGFGVVVAQRLAEGPVPGCVRVLEVGIGGIHLVQELLDPVDALVVVDAVDIGRQPGMVVVVRPDVADVTSMSVSERHDQLADMHYAAPDRALMLAQGLGLLPGAVWVIGCQVEDVERLGAGLSSRAAAAVEIAATEVRRIVSDLGIPWP